LAVFLHITGNSYQLPLRELGAEQIQSSFHAFLRATTDHNPLTQVQETLSQSKPYAPCTASDDNCLQISPRCTNLIVSMTALVIPETGKICIPVFNPRYLLS
jgi:hypothetical protein